MNLSFKQCSTQRTFCKNDNYITFCVQNISLNRDSTDMCQTQIAVKGHTANFKWDNSKYSHRQNYMRLNNILYLYTQYIPEYSRIIHELSKNYVYEKQGTQ